MKQTPDAMSGLIAASIAADAGRISRGYSLNEKELKRLKNASKAAYNLHAVLIKDISFWEYSVRESSYERLFAYAWASGDLTAEIPERLLVLGSLLRKLSDQKNLNPGELDDIHDLFAKLANMVNASFTSSGETAQIKSSNSSLRFA